MGAFGNFVRSLVGGNDHELAATQYAGRESASAAAARKTAEREQRAAERRRQQHRSSGIREASRASERWEAGDRRRQRTGASWNRTA